MRFYWPYKPAACRLPPAACRLPAIITFEDYNFASFHLIDTRHASFSNCFLSTQHLLHV
ncbi:MAG: hypothetical protein ACRDD5_14125 [Silvania sp.]|uniref:hypothetical protein n=1 Tax=Silvania sp. TaxID=3016633 RepID=UPI003EE5D227